MQPLQKELQKAHVTLHALVGTGDYKCASAALPVT